MSLPLQVIEGIFIQDADGFSVQSSEGHVSLDQVLSELAGRAVEVHLHYLPPSPPDTSLPGAGSCLWGGHCPHGHKDNPGWLFRQDAKGMLTEECEHEWSVGGDPLRLDLMPGHRGRLVVLDEDALKPPDPDDQRPTEDLIQEAEALLSLLGGLQKAVKP